MPEEGKKNGPIAFLAKATQRRPTALLFQDDRGAMCFSNHLQLDTTAHLGIGHWVDLEDLWVACTSTSLIPWALKMPPLA